MDNGKASITSRRQYIQKYLASESSLEVFNFLTVSERWGYMGGICSWQNLWCGYKYVQSIFSKIKENKTSE